MQTITITEAAFCDYAVAQAAFARPSATVDRREAHGAGIAPKKAPRGVVRLPSRPGTSWKQALRLPLTLASGIHGLFSGMTLLGKVALFILLILAVAGACVAAVPWLLMRVIPPIADDDDAY